MFVGLGTSQYQWMVSRVTSCFQVLSWSGIWKIFSKKFHSSRETSSWSWAATKISIKLGNSKYILGDKQIKQTNTYQIGVICPRFYQWQAYHVVQQGYTPSCLLGWRNTGSSSSRWSWGSRTTTLTMVSLEGNCKCPSIWVFSTDDNSGRTPLLLSDSSPCLIHHTTPRHRWRFSKHSGRSGQWQGLDIGPSDSEVHSRVS